MADPRIQPQTKAEFKSDAGAFFDNAVSAAIALLNAIEKAGSTDYDAIVQGAADQTGRYAARKHPFDERGDAIGVGFAMYQVKNGQYVELK
jgi:branched-chain amino acid transport system substrate-binding protein